MQGNDRVVRGYALLTMTPERRSPCAKPCKLSCSVVKREQTTRRRAAAAAAAAAADRVLPSAAEHAYTSERL